jgi:hypothetical protein
LGSVSSSAASSDEAETVLVANPNIPGRIVRVDARNYRSMRETLLAVLPAEGPGLTQPEMISRCTREADRHVFADPGKVGWWVKCVQLDLEAKALVANDHAVPYPRWRRVGRTTDLVGTPP